MNDVLKNRELVSALADGQLRGSDLANAIRLAASDADAQSAWHAYHLLGDVLRSSDLARAASDTAFMARLRESLAAESTPSDAPMMAVVAPHAGTVMQAAGEPAANESIFRWKLVAGFACLAAVGAIGWNAVGALGSSGTQAELARTTVNQSAVVASAVPSTPAVAQSQTQSQVIVAGSPTVMIRDPRLDELLAAHRQFGGTSALQMPAGFLRNATFETPGR